jgi:hypothetical protein
VKFVDQVTHPKSNANDYEPMHMTDDDDDIEMGYDHTDEHAENSEAVADETAEHKEPEPVRDQVIENAEGAVATRPRRETQKPKYLDDYVTEILAHDMSVDYCYR